MHAISYPLKLQSCNLRWAWSGIPKEAFETYISQKRYNNKNLFIFIKSGLKKLPLSKGKPRTPANTCDEQLRNNS